MSGKTASKFFSKFTTTIADISGKARDLCCRAHARRGVGGLRLILQLLRELATRHQHEDDHHHLPDGLRAAELAEPRRQGAAGKARRVDPDITGADQVRRHRRARRGAATGDEQTLAGKADRVEDVADDKAEAREAGQASAPARTSLWPANATAASDSRRNLKRHVIKSKCVRSFEVPGRADQQGSCHCPRTISSSAPQEETCSSRRCRARRSRLRCPKKLNGHEERQALFPGLHHPALHQNPL